MKISSIEEVQEIEEILTRPYNKIDIDKAISLRIKGLTYREIAKQFDCSHVSVYQRLQGLIPEAVDISAFKKHRADLLTAKQSELLSSLTTEDIKEASPYQRVGMFGILYDKERLERDLSTSNTYNYSVYEDNSQRRHDRLQELQRERELLSGEG